MKTSPVQEYNRFEDAGHSWLAVPISDVYDADIYSSISKYSPVKFGVMYLEEDCDMYTFCKAMEDKGVTVSMKDVFVEDFRAYLRSI